MIPDLVYPVRQGPVDSYNELRYSLRSAQVNLDLGEVWVLGSAPRWATGINHMRVPQNASKYVNVRRLIKQACLSEHVSDPFILMNDDIFFLKPQRLDALRLMHGGPLRQYLDLHGRHDAYARGGRKTVELLAQRGYENPLNWGLHVPLLIHKEHMLAALDLVGESVVPWHLRSIYGNLAGLQGEKHRDVKIMSGADIGGTWPYVSTSDISFRTRQVGARIRALFPTASRFEH